MFVAGSTGLIEVFAVAENGATKLRQYKAADAEILVLSLHVVQRNDEVLIGLTLSDGRTGIATVGSQDYELKHIDWTSSHDLEAWTIRIEADGEVIRCWTGGDDAKLLHSEVAMDSQMTTKWSDRRTHDAGVTAILPIANGLVITGSYDESIRLLKAPIGPGRPQILAELGLEGGVWRLQFIYSNLILASCMHAGCRIIHLRGREELEVIAKFEEHQSMNYGSDVIPGRENMVVSTSFYDRLVCLWRYPWTDSELG